MSGVKKKWWPEALMSIAASVSVLLHSWRGPCLVCGFGVGLTNYAKP